MSRTLVGRRAEPDDRPARRQRAGDAGADVLVDDITAAVARVRAAGGTAADPERQPYGISAHCTGDQGTPFYLGQL